MISNIESSPWEKITIPEAHFNVRQVAAKTITPCFWGRDSEGAYLFIIELPGDHTDQYHRNAVRVRGIKSDLRAESGSCQRLVLTLEGQADRDLFEDLCHSLATALEHVKDSADSLTIILTHIRRWKNFFTNKNPRLSPEEIRGLFSEIVFLIELIKNGLSNDEAVQAWLGPDRSHQDFIFRNTSVEIKSLSNTERNSIRISSEDQLESLSRRLFLRVYHLSSLVGSAESRSLNDVITEIFSLITPSDAVEVLARKLSAYGYAPLPIYDQPRFVISDSLSYLIAAEFPRLVRSQLPNGIASVSYDVKLEAISRYKVEFIDILGDV